MTVSWLPTATTTADMLGSGWAPALIPDTLVAPTPPAPDDVGSDLVLWDDITVDCAEYVPDDPLVVAQDCYHRLNTRRDLIVDALDWGIDMSDYLMSGLPRGGISTLESIVGAELRKDERISGLKVSVTAVDRSFRITILAETTAGPFRLTMSVSDSGALLQEVARG